MGTGRKFSKKPVTRPKKSPCERARRFRVHKARLIGLGMSEELVGTLQDFEARKLLKRPAKVKALFAEPVAAE